MGRFWIGQMRPLLVVWLLATVPVVCNHATAEFILGSVVEYLTAGGQHHAPLHPSLAGHHHHAYGHPAPASGVAVTVPAAPGDSDGAGLAWCAHHPGERAHFLPEGQGSLALDSAIRWFVQLQTAPATVSLGARHPPGIAPAPPVPPPRSVA